LKCRGILPSIEIFQTEKWMSLIPLAENLLFQCQWYIFDDPQAMAYQTSIGFEVSGRCILGIPTGNGFHRIIL
jgi:hypothetical protein